MPLLELRDAHRITVRDNRVVHAARLVMADAASSDVHVTGNH
jgi:hypothetical protein